MLDQALAIVKAEFQKDLQNLKAENALRQEKMKDDLEKRIFDLESENKNLMDRVYDLENKASINPPLFSNLFGKTKPAEIETKVLNAISAEAKEKSSKEKNVAIFGLVESTKTNKDEKEMEDKMKIDEIFSALNLNGINIEKHYRLKNSSNHSGGIVQRPGIVIVELKTKLDQQQVLQESRNLNNINEFKGKVYINQDLTIAERASLKMLLSERKRLNQIEIDNKSPFRYVIRNDKLQRLQPKTLI